MQGASYRSQSAHRRESGCRPSWVPRLRFQDSGLIGRAVTIQGGGRHSGDDPAHGPVAQNGLRRRTRPFRRHQSAGARREWLACAAPGIAEGSAHRVQRWRSSQLTSSSETCSGWSVPRRWFASGTVTSSAPGMRSARIRPFAGGTSASSSPCTTSVGAVRLPLAATNEGYLAQASGTSQWDGYDRLDRITARTLVVHGELDALVPPANGRILADRIPGAELVTVPLANHLLGTDQPEQVSELLVNWLDRHR